VIAKKPAPPRRYEMRYGAKLLFSASIGALAGFVWFVIISGNLTPVALLPLIASAICALAALLVPYKEVS
jgi:hypothetical protein